MNLKTHYSLIVFLTIIVHCNVKGINNCLVEDTISFQFYKSYFEDVDKRGKKCFSVGTGIALWYKSDQPVLNNQQFPIHVYGEFGYSKQKFSYFADFNFITKFKASDYSLKPTVLNLGLKYSFIKTKDKVNYSFDFFALGGPSFWYTKLLNTRNLTDGIKEKETYGVGVNFGSGVSYKYRRIKLTAMFLFQTGWADYFTGPSIKINMEPGSYQAVVLLTYCFFGKHHTGFCPAY